MLERTGLAVVGGGWAGIAAALEATAAGDRTCVFEAAPALGGRARRVALRLGGADVEVDNGQHLLIGAYTECLRVIGLTGVSVEAVLRRRPMRLTATDGLHIAPPPLPAPWHLLVGLLAARGMRVGERWAMARLMSTLRARGWQAAGASTVDDLLDALGQPESLRRRVWEPLCIAALNTAAHEACAQTFANVLRDALGGDARSSDFLLPIGTLSDVLPAPAERRLRERGAGVHLRTQVRLLLPADGGWTLVTDRGNWHAERVILALPPFAAARLLQATIYGDPARDAVISALRGYDYDSIATAYLSWAPGLRIELPEWVMLREQPGDGRFGQWLFDRGTLAQRRVAAVVVSARGRVGDIDPQALARGIAEQATEQLHLPAPSDARVIVEKRATFRCRPGRARLTPDTLAALAPPGDPLSRLFLAGDFAYPDYPATLESAVRAGVQAARLALAAR
jgi:squalene-associated FAD-dependent desaturase